MSYKSLISKANRIEEATAFPEVILIDNCNACNLRCSMCDHINMQKYRKIQVMDFHLYQKIIDEIAVENPTARVWQIFFGDPFMCHDMAKRIRYAKKKGLTDVVLNTNGALMSRENTKKVIEAGLDTMYVGIDAAKERTYEKIRIGGDYRKAVKNTLYYRDILNEVGNSNQQLFVQFVINDINEGEVSDFKKFWTSQKINVKIRPKISWAGLIEATNLRNNDILERKPCYWLMQSMNICADGRIALCSVDIHCRVDCGDVKKDSLKKIWQSTLKEYRNFHKQSRFNEMPEMCSNCMDWQSAYADFQHVKS